MSYKGPVSERFWSSVEKSENCWLWTGTHDCWGYGQLGVGQSTKRSHRLSWELHFGEIPAKTRVRILCGNRLCVRPDHLTIRTINAEHGQQCLEWQGTRNDRGYGQRRLNGQLQYVHRIIWEQVYGPITEGLQVLHRCDNPPCYNIDHLFLGTQADNMADMRAKGRGRKRAQN